MSRSFPLVAVFFIVTASGCTCGAFDVKNTRFACATDADCGADFSCVAGECVAACSTAAPCPSGLDCTAGRCVDRDECRAGAACGTNAQCTNTPGSFECRCAQGYAGATTTGQPATCVDVDECAAMPDCGPLGVCANTPGQYECTCPTGTFGATVVGGPTSCSTTDRCQTAGQCGANANCQSTASSYTCTCASGFMGAVTTGMAATCTDVDECSMGQPCGANALCANSLGSFKCTCAAGFMGDTTAGMAATCVDVDECPGANCGANATCRNTSGSYECACLSGFTGTPVMGGPATCTMATGSCAGVSCGANATCTPLNGSYSCSCNAGYMGATVPGGPASCVDTDECSDPTSCGSNANCMNAPGTYSCTCASGFSGTPTQGMPATCVANGVMPLGSAESLAAPMVVLTRPVPSGDHLVLAYFGANAANSVSDTRGNTWTRLVTNSTCGTCGTSSLWSTTVRDGGLATGDTISVPTSSSSAIWVVNAGPYASPDITGTAVDSQNTTTPSIVTASAITEPDELVVGVFGTRNAVNLSLDAGSYDVGFTTNGSQLSGIVGWRAGVRPLTPVTFSATASSSLRFSGALATFYSAPQQNPSALTLSHTANTRSFTVSWSAGRSNGGTNGCAIQVQLFDGSWSSLASGNCDADTVGRTVNLPAAVNWYGSSWAMVPVRLMRVTDQAVIGTFLTRLTCATRAASSTSTPTVDEDCDSEWDDHLCQQYDWVSGMVYGNTFAACTNANTTASKACSSTNENENRYTVGMTAGFTPAMTFSSDAVGTACMGSFVGAVQWTCTPSNCTYR